MWVPHALKISGSLNSFSKHDRRELFPSPANPRHLGGRTTRIGGAGAQPPKATGFDCSPKRHNWGLDSGPGPRSETGTGNNRRKAEMPLTEASSDKSCPTNSRNSDHDELLRRFEAGDASGGEISGRHLLSPEVTGLVALTSLIALDRLEDFEEHARVEVKAGLAPDAVLDMLLELVDLGVRVPDRAFRFVRTLMKDH
jgi:hypothetical protein